MPVLQFRCEVNMMPYAVEAIFHEPNSRFAFPLSKTSIQVRIQTKKDDCKFIDVIYQDIYNWEKVNDHHQWMYDTVRMTKRFSDEYSDYYVGDLVVTTKRFKYAFLLDGQVLYGQLGLYGGNVNLNHVHNYFTYPYINYSELPQSPSWLTGLTWYQIFVDRFYTSSPRLDWSTHPVTNEQIFGGNLKGIIQQLDYLANLGIGGLYLNPIFESPTAHKYDTTDYYHIDSSFGSMNDLKELVKQAHAKNIKIMIDGVFNHAGYEHPFFQDVIEQQETSPYKDYFLVKSFPIEKEGSNGRPSYECFGYAPNMPKWNTENPKVREYLSDIALYYAKEIGVDGWRMDVSEEPTHMLWREMNQKIRPIKPDFYFLAENWYDANAWLSQSQFDSVMNYTYTFALSDYFRNEIDVNTLKNRLHQLLWRYPDLLLKQLFNIVDTHDTARIKTQLPKYYLAIIGFIFAMPGTPNLYYGTEIGMEGDNDPDCRRPFAWDHFPDEITPIIERLIQFRHHTVAQSLDIQFDTFENSVIFEKKNGETMLGILSSEDKIHIPKKYQNLKVYDLLQGEETVLESTRIIPHFIGLYLLSE